MGKQKQQKQQKQKPAKQEEARAREAEMIRVQLEDLGFPEDDLKPIKEALQTFVDRGEGWTETYKLPHLGVEVLLQLSMQPHVVSFARVRKKS